MPSRSRAALLGALTVVLAMTGALPALAAEISNSEFVIIQPEDTLEDDLYAGAIKVSIEGVLDGDLIAFAGEEIVIDGTVTGSVFASAPRVIVNGTVSESLRVVANDLTVSGDVGRDIVATAFDVDLTAGSSVGNDVVLWAWDVNALGHIGGDLSGSQRSLSLAGGVDGDVDVSVRQVTAVDSLVVGGDFGYRSANVAEGLDQAEIKGATVHKTPLPPNIRVRALNVFGQFMVILFLTITALAVSYGWPDRTLRAVEAVTRSPFRAWGLGALVMASPLLLALLAALVLGLAPASASFPLLAFVGPLVLAMAGLVMILGLVAGIPTAGRVGTVLYRRKDIYLAMVIGSLAIGVLWLLPYIGLVVPLLALPLGLGGWMISWRNAGSDDLEAPA